MSGTPEHHTPIFEHPHGPVVGEVEIDRLLTAPNVITTLRLCCLPVFLYLLLGRDAPLAAGLLLGALGSTDWVDGYVARRFGQSSTFGKMYDPTVDRIVMVVAIVAIISYLDDPAFRVYAAVVVVREVVVGLYVAVITLLGAKRLNVTWWGKVGTFANMFAFPFFLIAADPGRPDWWEPLWTTVAWIAAVPGVVFGLASAVQYFRTGPEALAEGRAARAALAASVAAEGVDR